jgi:ABC-type nitrate/sulfonate/bicarbonate transport system substrate-binding protein
LRHIWRLSYIVAAAAAVSAMTPKASAQDSLKVAVDQRGAWGTAALELGQRAGIFKRHGLTLDLTYPRAESEIETAVISGGGLSKIAHICRLIVIGGGYYQARNRRGQRLS